MARNVEHEVLLGFVEEARSYLPTIHDGLAALERDAAAVGSLDEVHRQVHCIKGAAALVGLAGLSHIAFGVEDALEDLAFGKLAWTPDSGKILRCAVDQIEAYLDGVLAGTLAEPSLVDAARRTMGRLRGVPEISAAVAANEPADVAAEQPDIAAVEQATVDAEADAARFETWAPVAGESCRAGAALAPSEPAGWLDGAEREAPTGPAFAFDMEESFEAPPAPPEMPEFLIGADEEAHRGAAEEEDEPVSPELLEIFRLEAEDHLRIIHASLPGLEADAGNRDLLQEVRRSAHTLKGAAAMVGFRQVTQLAHRMEDVLDLMYEGGGQLTPDVLRLLFTSTDGLEDLAGGKDVDAALPSLYAAYDRLLGGHAPGAGLAAAMDHAAEAPAEAPAEALADASDAAASQAPQRNASQFVRVPIDRLDELVKLVSELVIVRTQFEQRMVNFNQLSGELIPSSDRLRRASQKLETQYEAKGMASGRSAGPALPAGDSHTPVNRLLSAHQAHQPHGFDDLEFDRYTEFHLLSRELAETTSDIQTVAGEFSHLIGDFDGCLTRQARLCREVEDKLRRLRMVPLSTLASRLHRTVRNVAQTQHKQVDLVLEGESTELDKTVLEQLSDPLMHLLRNAVDHGVESPAERVAAGKPAKGTIRLRAFPEGSQVVVQISDDGAGVDAGRVRAIAVQRSLLTEDEAAARTVDELAELLFQPGFSTAREVSEISGRGVGLDIVKTQVQMLKGVLTLEPRPGLGAQFTIRLPMTLAIARALLVKAQQQTFAVPLESVRQIVRLEPGMAESLGQKPVVRVGGQVLPLFHLSRLLNLKHTADEAAARPPLLVLQAGAQVVAVVVDQLVGGREIVIKNLGAHLKRVPGVTGATLMGDGSAVLILNPAELVGAGFTRAASSTPARKLAPAKPAPRQRRSLNVMIVDDSPSVRRVVSNLMKRADWNAVTAKDGLDAIEQLQRSAVLPDVVLLDIEMPRMDGYELLATLRANEAYRALPVVFITSRANEKHRRKAVELGASGYVVKPYQDEALLALIRKLATEPQQAVLA